MTVWYAVAVGVLVVFAILQLALTRSSARRRSEHERRMDEIYGYTRDGRSGEGR